MDEKTQVIDAIYDTYDNERCGYLNVKQLRSVHTDIRIDGISYDQVIYLIYFIIVATPRIIIYNL